MKWLVTLGLILMLPAQLAWAAGENPVQLKDVPAQTVLSIKTKISMEKIAEEIGRLYERLYDHINKKAVQPAGPPMALYYSPPGPEIELAACVPVPDGLAGDGDITAIRLPGGQMASIMHPGSYEGIGQAYETIMAWISDNGYRPAGPSREIYWVGPGMESDPAKYRTEILWPVSK